MNKNSKSNLYIISSFRNIKGEKRDMILDFDGGSYGNSTIFETTLLKGLNLNTTSQPKLYSNQLYSLTFESEGL